MPYLRCSVFFIIICYYIAVTYEFSEPRIVLSKSQCKNKEFYNTCGSKCAPACNPSKHSCGECTEGCYCKKPFIRSHFGGPCLLQCANRTRVRPPRKINSNRVFFKARPQWFRSSPADKYLPELVKKALKKSPK